jgi:tRNA-dihydrouridine synthase
MDGVTDEPMRQIQCSIAKPDVIYTEFISAEGFVRKPEVFKKKLAFLENERPIVCQIVGYTPSAFYKTISQIVKMGFDGIDINMGCPNKDVIKKGAGAALIDNFILAEKIITACLRATKNKIPLSVKTRITEDSASTKKWITFLSQFPLAAITIHGRPVSQSLSGPVNWPEIGKAAAILRKNKIICLGNGGIKSVSEGEAWCQKYGLDGFLIGQAALGNPWVFKKNYQPKIEEILATILRHGQRVWDFYGKKGYKTVLKHYSWYPRNFANCKQLKISLLQTKTIGETKSLFTDKQFPKRRLAGKRFL